MTYIDEMIKELCPDGVEWKELGEVCELKNGYTPSKSNNEFWENGDVPWFRLEDIRKNGRVLSDAIQHVTNEAVKKELFPANSLIISTTATIGEVALVTVPFLCNQQITAITPIKKYANLLDVKFLFHYMQILSTEMKRGINEGSFPIISLSKMKGFQIPLPPREIQEEIVKILDKFTEYVTELTAELTAELTFRQKQYSFYRDRLLSFEDEVYQVEWKTLGELFEFKNGLNKGKEFFGKGTPIVNYTDVYRNIKLTNISLKGTVDVSREEQERYSVKRGDVFFTRTSETQEEIGKTSVLLEDIKDGVFSGFVLRARPKTELLLPEYCAYCFNSSDFRKAIVRYSTYTTRALTNGGTLSKLSIPVPPLAIQSRIVEVLDKFDTVCNVLNIGLPKEIELRQKQYEFFRDKLLTFTAEGVYTDSTVQTRPD